MTPPPHIAMPVLAVVAALGLSACTPDTEEGFRDEVSAWLALGDTLYFKATRACTAGVFETRSGTLTSAMRSVTSWREADQALEKDRAVAFENVSLSPSDFTGIIMDQEPTLGSQIISAGLAIRDCMDATREAQYANVLRDKDAALMFDPASQTVGILSSDRSTVFIGRGEPK